MNKRLIYALISLIVFIGIFFFVIFGNHSLDLKISESMDKINDGNLQSVFIFLDGYFNFILVAIALLFMGIFVSMKKKKNVFIMVLSLGGGYLIEKIIKLFFERQRPALQIVQDLENSFPSGHATFSIILFSLLIYFYKDEIKNKIRRNWFISLNIILILFVGFSRLYVNIHWFSDIIGGFFLGFFVFNFILFLFYKKNKS